MALVGDAASAAMSGVQVRSAAEHIVRSRHPTLRELAAAQRENLEVHGGGTPDILRDLGMSASPVPAEILRLREAVAAVLNQAARMVDEAAG